MTKLNEVAINRRSKVINELGLQVQDKWEIGSYYDNAIHAYCLFKGKNGKDYCFSITPTSILLTEGEWTRVYKGSDIKALIKAIREVM